MGLTAERLAEIREEVRMQGGGGMEADLLEGIDLLVEALKDCLGQACGEWSSAVFIRDPASPSGHRLIRDAEFKGYDSMCLSAYENGLLLLVEMGAIEKREVTR